jgi:glycosyltransferase involved in cell wall biosynthesis
VAHAHLFHAATLVRLLVPRPARRVSSLHVVERRRLPLRFAVARWLAGRDDATTAVSDAVAEFAQSRLGVTAPRVVPNGVDLARFATLPDRAAARAALGLGDGPLVGALGRLDRQKGFDVLLPALVELEGVSLALAGAGPEREALEAQARTLGIADRVRFLGLLDDVRPLLAACDVFCMPSRWEGFGLALAEAMACGLPCVASRIDSLPEVLGDAGVLVPVEDPRALAQAVDALLADPDGARALGEAARARAQRYAVESMVAGYAAIYAEVAGGGPVPPQGGRPDTPGRG